MREVKPKMKSISYIFRVVRANTHPNCTDVERDTRAEIQTDIRIIMHI